jgi:hypothetical protein
MQFNQSAVTTADPEGMESRISLQPTSSSHLRKSREEQYSLDAIKHKVDYLVRTEEVKQPGDLEGRRSNRA